MSFPNEGDGIVEVDPTPFSNSYFKWPYEASMASIVDRLKFRYFREKTLYPHPPKVIKQANANYFVRTRTTLSSGGEVKTANYTKLLNGFNFDPRKDPDNKKPNDGEVVFTYYFNPTPNDKNLEFDPKRNLFKDIKRPIRES